MFLVTTANQNYWKKDERILFLGEWCTLYNQKYIWSNLNYEILPSHWDECKKFNEHEAYLEQTCEKYLNNLARCLNYSHNVNYSLRYWRIILGPWLTVFIGVVYDRFLSINSAIKSNKPTHTWIAPLNWGKWVPQDTRNFISMCSEDINFNLYLYSKIIFNLGKIPFDLKEDQEFSTLPNLEKNKSSSSSETIKVKNFLAKIFNLFPDRYNHFYFSSSSLSYRNQLKLQLSLGEVPYLPQKPFGPLIKEIDINLRQDLKLPKGENEFEMFLNGLLVEQFPKVFLEGYSEIHKKSLDSFPKNPKIIFTSLDFTTNESFKFWAAAKTEKDASLVISQHGGGYGMSPLVTLNHEKKICDKYFSWGWTLNEEPKIVPMPAGKLQSNKSNIKSDAKGTILMISQTWPIYFTRIDHVAMGFHGSDYFHRQKRFLEFVNPEVFKILLLRLADNNFGWNEKERLSNLDSTPNYYMGPDPMLSQIKKSRLCIHDYLATTWLETMSMNFPTVVFWDPTKVSTLMSAQLFLEDIRSVDILHDTPEAAANLVNEIYEDPLTWWMSPERQQAKDKFCCQFARKSESWLEEWKEELLKMSK